MPSRRQLLIALGTAGAVLGALAVGTGAVVGRWYGRAPGGGFRHLSEDEAAIARAIAGAAWPATALTPLSGDQADLDYFLDELIAPWPENMRDLMRVLLHAIEDLSRLEGGAAFTALPLDERTRLLMGWLESDTAELRSAVSSAVILLGMGWTTHPDVGGPLPHLYRCGYYR